MLINRNNINKDLDEIISAIEMAGDTAQIKAFLHDILTEKEIKEFANRWRIAKMLNTGISWNKISQTTGASTATISQINKKVKSKKGGIYALLSKIYFTRGL